MDQNIDNDNENRLVNMLINTKFRIEARLISKVQINTKQYATMFGTNYFNQEDFQKEFGKVFWFTYRRNFVPLLIEKNKVAKLTTDAGWGCVIRCTQMLIANCFRTLTKNQIKSP